LAVDFRAKLNSPAAFDCVYVTVPVPYDIAEEFHGTWTFSH
jgi:hypothetical protein